MVLLGFQQFDEFLERLVENRIKCTCITGKCPVSMNQIHNKAIAVHLVIVLVGVVAACWGAVNAAAIETLESWRTLRISRLRIFVECAGVGVAHKKPRLAFENSRKYC